MKKTTLDLTGIFDTLSKIGGLLKIFGYLPLIFSPLWFYTFLRDLTKKYLAHKKNLKNPEFRNRNKGKTAK